MKIISPLYRLRAFVIASQGNCFSWVCRLFSSSYLGIRAQRNPALFQKICLIMGLQWITVKTLVPAMPG